MHFIHTRFYDKKEKEKSVDLTKPKKNKLYIRFIKEGREKNLSAIFTQFDDVFLF
jgi:hypothetical protein